MKKFNLSGLFALSLAMIAPMKIQAQEGGEFIFTYAYEGAELDLFGVQRNVGIDAAMLLQDPSLVGAEVVGVSVDIPTKEGCSCDPIASAWLTKKLQTEGEYNLPDTQQVNGEIKNYGSEENPELRLDLTFPVPYTLTEDGIYVGYSVTVTSCNVPGSGWTAKYPIYTVNNVEKPQGMMIHTTATGSQLPQKYPDWVDLGIDRKQALAMRVILRGKTMSDAASLDPKQTIYVEPSSSGLVYTDLNNYGDSPISSIEYTYTIKDGEETVSSATKELTLDESVPGNPGAYTTLDLSFDSPETEGEYSVELRVDKVNGEENEFEGTTSFNMVVVPFLPKNRPLVEDCTGFWCGYCPYVWVTTHQMMDKYGEDFLSLSYHTADRIQGVEDDAMPIDTYGPPRVYLNDRHESIKKENTESLWLLKRRELAPADIDLNIYWTDDSQTALRAESNLKFVYDDPEADYMLTYALVEDGMSSPSWSQANYYYEDNFTGPYWDFFCGKEYHVTGIVYDDVVVSFPNTKGIPSSVPSEIIGGESYKHVSTLELKDAVSRYSSSSNYNQSIILDKDKLRVVALLIDAKTGNVCNAASSGYSKDAKVYVDNSAIESVESNGTESEVLSIEYFSLDGVRLEAAPSSGAAIAVKHMTDGSLKTEKIMK